MPDIIRGLDLSAVTPDSRTIDVVDVRISAEGDNLVLASVLTPAARDWFRQQTDFARWGTQYVIPHHLVEAVSSDLIDAGLIVE